MDYRPALKITLLSCSCFCGLMTLSRRGSAVRTISVILQSYDVCPSVVFQSHKFAPMVFARDAQGCLVLNSSMMRCAMPEVQLPTEFQVEDDDDDDTVSAGGGVRSLSGGSDDQYRAEVYVGVLFDGYDRYANLTEAEPSLQFQFFHPPTFDSADLIVYRPHSLTGIDVTVRRLVAFCQLANLYLPQKKRKNTGK